jgi:phosphoadenosine phosphosulfate reductase
MLVTETLFGTIDKVKIAIDRIRQFEPPEGYYLAFSGGKDSQTIYHLALEAGVKFDAHYNLTTVDPPELVRFIKSNYHDVIIERPRFTMWELIVKNGVPPTQLQRYCCRELKEKGGENRMSITGVRWAESVRRSKTRAMLEKFGKDKILFNDNNDTRKMIDICQLKSKRILNPIIDWEDDEVWDYLNLRKIKHCELYDQGYHRLGCIGCSMGNQEQRLWQFARWPKYYQAYLRAFDRMLIQREKRGKTTKWKTAHDVMDWWIYEMPKTDPDQLKLFED